MDAELCVCGKPEREHPWDCCVSFEPEELANQPGPSTVRFSVEQQSGNTHFARNNMLN